MQNAALHDRWAGLLGQLAEREDLTPDQSRQAMADVLDGSTSDAQLGGFLMALKTKGETSSEIVGLVQAMREAAVPLTMPDNAVDIVGTGGSAHRRTHALNVSTMAAFVAASAGGVVCKHGNYRASSTSGSFDFLEALGIHADLDAGELEACVAANGLGFALARVFHPSMRFAAGVRRELGVPTVFNLLGPPAHPAQLTRQVIGVANESLAVVIADSVNALGAEHTWVVTGEGGLDEITSTGPSVIYEVRDGGVERREIDLEFLGIAHRGSIADLKGGDAAENVNIFDAILSGSETGPRRQIVCLNAAAGLVVGGVADSLAGGLALANAAIDDGRAATKLDQVRQWTQDAVAARSE